jgi:FkbM family methyltransferase
MQRLYALLRGHHGVLKFRLHGVEACFSARTPVELRIVEAAWFGEREMIEAVQKMLREGDTFLDVGSNLGIFTIYAAKAVGPQGMVIAFEPETMAYQRLQRNLEINSLKNVTAFKLALSDTRSMKNLVLGDSGGVAQSAHISDGEGPGEKVQATDFDFLVEREGVSLPRVVKMDVEGHEYAALQGMKRTLSSSSCEGLFCEIHPYALPEGIKAADVMGIIESTGFEILSKRERGPQVHVIAKKLIK